jgi:hypothetical protein
MRKSLIALLFLALCPLLVAQQALDNDAIIKLVKAGLSDDLIVTTINTSAGTYNTSVDGIIALKTAGVSDKVVSAVVAKASAVAAAASAPIPPLAPMTSQAPAAASNIPAGVDSIGIYYQDKDGSWQEVVTEAVTKKTGGILKTIATDGMLKGDINGNLKGAGSRLRLTLPAHFILYVPEGRSPGEYELIRFRVHSHDREFRSVTGGFVHVSSGAARDSVEFDSKKIAPRIYQVTLDQNLARGEYGFLAPTDTGNMGNVASSGKMYTFSILE